MGMIGEWKGTISVRGEKNYLTDSIHRPPLKVLNFSGEDGESIVYLASNSPGLFNGDRQEISCMLMEGAHLFLTNASATELHPSLTQEECRQNQIFQLEKNSKFEYMSEPLIPFKGSNYAGKMSIYMTEGAQAIVGDMITAGRVGRGEIFEYQCLQSRFEMYWDGQLHAWDSIRLMPESNLKENGVLGEFTHMSTLWILSEQIKAEHLQHIQNEILKVEELDGYGGASLLESRGIVIRVLGHSAQTLQRILKTCWNYFRLELFHL